MTYHLFDLHIPLTVDLPVGKKYDDHMAFSINLRINQSIHLDKTKALGWRSMLEYKMYRTGPLTSFTENFAFLHID